LQKRMAKVGFDWPSLAPVLAKVDEELAELKAAVGEKGHKSKSRVAEELGDLLFVMANVARRLDIDPEAALRAANAKVVRRFQSIEVALAEDGRRPEDATLDEMDQLWDEAKEAETKD
jgi:ATP diphosphatase